MPVAFFEVCKCMKKNQNMKKYTIILISIMALVIVVQHGMHRKDVKEIERLESNQASLITGAREFKTKDSLNASMVDRLQLTIKELKRLNDDKESIISDLGVKLKRVESVSTSATEVKREVVVETRDSFIFMDRPVKTLRFSDEYLTLSGLIEDNKFTGLIVSRDTLIQVVHRVPRKFLFIKYGTKAIRQSIVSRNPYSRIVYQEYVEIK